MTVGLTLRFGCILSTASFWGGGGGHVETPCTSVFGYETPKSFDGGVTRAYCTTISVSRHLRFYDRQYGETIAIFSFFV